MNTLFLVVWLMVAHGSCNPNTGVCIDYNDAIQSQIVSSESELNDVYQQHKDDGVRVFRLENNEPFLISVKEQCAPWFNAKYDENFKGMICYTNPNFKELEFKPKPSGDWVEKDIKIINNKIFFGAINITDCKKSCSAEFWSQDSCNSLCDERYGKVAK